MRAANRVPYTRKVDVSLLASHIFFLFPSLNEGITNFHIATVSRIDAFCTFYEGNRGYQDVFVAANEVPGQED